MEITNEFKERVFESLLLARDRYTGNTKSFCKQFEISDSVFSRLKSGERGQLLSDPKWISVARKLGVEQSKKVWKLARTEVFEQIEYDIRMCQENSRAMVFVDDCAIGKSFAAKYLCRMVLKNAFYVDCSQCKTKIEFVRELARSIGVDAGGRVVDVRSDIIYSLKNLDSPVVILDEAGDMGYQAFLEIKSLYNAVDGYCGWYMIGADGMRAKIERGVRSKKVGFREILSRFSDTFLSIVPKGKEDKRDFYKTLITEVVSVNLPDKKDLTRLVAKCMEPNSAGDISGLRRVETILLEFLKNQTVNNEKHIAQ